MKYENMKAQKFEKKGDTNVSALLYLQRRIALTSRKSRIAAIY